MPGAVTRTVSVWLAAHRTVHDIRSHQRAADCRVRAVLVLRWLVEATSMLDLARDAGVSLAVAPGSFHDITAAALQALSHVTLDPRTVTKIAATALVILNLNTGHRTLLPR